MSREVLNLKQAAEHVHLEENELKHFAQRGEIEATKRGDDWFFEHRALDEWAQRNLLAAMRKFELENGFAVFMTGIIEKFFRQLIDVKNGKTEGMNPYALRKNEGFLRNWSPAELRAARARFLMLREKVVSGTTSGDVLVTSTLVRVMRRARR